MSRLTDVIVLARDAEEVMRPLTERDEDRRWHQCFTPVDDSVFSGTGVQTGECYAWVVQFDRRNWTGLLDHLESLPWPDPYSVQVLIRDEEDSCFGLWMIYDGKLVEVPLPKTRRDDTEWALLGVLTRTDSETSE